MPYDYGQYFGGDHLTHDLTTLPGDRGGAWTSHCGKAPSGTRWTVTAVFDRLGVDYLAVGGPTYCCGIVHHQQGDTQAARGA